MFEACSQNRRRKRFLQTDMNRTKEKEKKNVPFSKCLFDVGLCVKMLSEVSSYQKTVLETA
jgi:hypothetical protein